MTLSCPRCHAQHTVDPPTSARTRARPLRFRCSDCGHTFPVQTDQGAALPPALLPVEPPSRFAQEPRSVAGGEPVEMLRVGGDVYHVPDMATLQRWILEGRANREDSVSQHGMRWAPIGERPDLALFFAASERVVPSDASLGASSGAPSTTSTIVPSVSPLSTPRAGLGLAPEEDMYVREVLETNTSFVATPPAAEEVPPAAEIPSPVQPNGADHVGSANDGREEIPNEATSEAIAAEEASPTSEVPFPTEPEPAGEGGYSNRGPNSLHVRSRTLEPQPGLSSNGGTRGVPAPNVGFSGGGFSGPGLSVRGLAAHPRNDEPTASAEPSGPVDEVPASIVARGDVDPMLETLRPSAFEHLRGDARALGFELGPDPDTQEATIEATQQANALADAFVATGNMGAPRRENPAEAPQYVPPPIDFGGGRVPITIAPMAATFGSVLDEPPPAASRPSPLVWAALVAVAFFGVGGLALAGWYASKPDPKPATKAESGLPATATLAEAEAEARARAAAEAGAGITMPGERPPASDNALATKDKAIADQASADQAAAAAAADKAAADKAAADKAAAEKLAADKLAAARAAETIVAEDNAAAAKKQADAARKAAEAKAAAAAAKASTTTAKSATKSTSKPTGTSAKALADAGWKAMDKGNIEEAHGYFSRALQTDAGNGWATYGRGYANEKLGDKVSARSDYCGALSRAPSDGELVAELNGSLRRLGVTCN